MTLWFYAHPKSRQPVGPVDASALLSLYASGALSPDSLVWHDGLPDWIPLRAALETPDAPLPSDRAPVPPRLTGWMLFDALMLLLLGLLLLPLFLLGLPLLVSAVALLRARSALLRLGTVPAETLPYFLRHRLALAAFGWTFALVLAAALVAVLAHCAVVFSLLAPGSLFSLPRP
jgi:type IV pilus assembly protein PilA